jgi:hypothetical protein
MSTDNPQITELQQVLASFITEQRQFNTEQRQFNTEQRQFNEKIDKKIDKVQYYLEESLAQTTKVFFEEQIELKAEVRSLEWQVSSLNEIVTHLMSELKQLQLKVA